MGFFPFDRGVATTSPYQPWMKQIARELTNFEDGFLNGKRYLTMDRDTKFCKSFRSTLQQSGVEPVILPSMNSQIERFFGSLKSESLDRMIFFGENSLINAVTSFLAHFHSERNHQGLGNKIIDPGEEAGRPDGEIECRDRLGGLLQYYYRKAA